MGTYRKLDQDIKKALGVEKVDRLDRIAYEAILIMTGSNLPMGRKKISSSDAIAAVNACAAFQLVNNLKRYPKVPVTGEGLNSIPGFPLDLSRRATATMAEAFLSMCEYARDPDPQYLEAYSET